MGKETDFANIKTNPKLDFYETDYFQGYRAKRSKNPLFGNLLFAFSFSPLDHCLVPKELVLRFIQKDSLKPIMNLL